MIKIAPSILSADLANLAAEVKSMEKAGVDYIHIDIMDGHFVPNITFGPWIVSACKKNTTLPLDVHLMVADPLTYGEICAQNGADFVTFHVEASPHLQRGLSKIKKLKAKVGLVLNPATSLETLKYSLNYIDIVLIMGVNPGFSGQSFLPETTQKVHELKIMLQKYAPHVLIEVDGGVSDKNIKQLSQAGADIVVSGSHLFGAENYKIAVENLKKPPLINKAIIMNIPIIKAEDYLQILQQTKEEYHNNYLIMYSSILGGFITDPTLWNIPIDDHLVHRSDGIFEVFFANNGRIYCYHEHLERLAKSAQAIDLEMPKDFKNLKEIIKQALHLGGEKTALIRLTISRGPGGFSANPYESVGSQMYVNTMKLKLPSEEDFYNGASLVRSPIPAKGKMFATVKSCAYLHNALVKKAATEQKADYAVCFTTDGYMTEGGTENIVMVNQENELLVPHWDTILKGTTLIRALDLAQELVKDGTLKSIKNANITEEDLNQAKEIWVLSTSISATAVTSWNGKKVGDGKQGAINKKLLPLMLKEMNSDNPHTVNMW